MRIAQANLQLNDVLLILVYGCYWSFFVLFAYPSEFFPQLNALVSRFYCAVVLFLVTLVASMAVVRMGARWVVRVARSTLFMLVPLLLLSGCVVSLITFRVAGAESPIALMLIFPVLLVWLGFCLSLRVCCYSAHVDSRKLPLVLAVSLLVSFMLGTILTLVEDVVRGDSANYIMLLAAGVLALVFASREQGADSFTRPMQKAPSGVCLSAQAAFVVALTLGFYLLGSGAFMSLSSAALDASWYSEGWIHCAIGAVLYVAFVLYAYRGVRVGRDPYPWLSVLLLCMACLYCSVLFYADLAVLCQEIVVASRPLVVVLLWAAVWEWCCSKDVPLWRVGITVPLVVFGLDVVIQALGLLGLSGDGLLMVVDGIMLATAFAMAAALVFLLSRYGLRGSYGVADGSSKLPASPPSVAQSTVSASPTALGDPSFVMERLKVTYGLSAREAEVLQLLYRGNTQKKIAESLFLSLSSVQTYSKSLYRKLGVHSRQELIDLVDAGEQ